MSWRLGVVGSPISHSLTPKIHAAALAGLGLVGSSEAIELDASNATRIQRIFDAHDALSVTMPLKETLVSWCDSLDETAQRIGAVNSLRFCDDQVHGRSTDGIGFLDAVASEMSFFVRDQHCVVRGSGGAAKALVDAFVLGGASRVSILARNANVAHLVAQTSRVIDVNPPRLDSVALVVNTLPHQAEADVELLEPPSTFVPDALAVDIVYVPARTPWLAAQEERGLRTMNGLAMLVHQARHQMEWWFEQPVDLATLFSAVRS